jgi:peroxiredoxin Q/BCP
VTPRRWSSGRTTKTRFGHTGARRTCPFVGLADPTHRVAKRYGRESRLLKLGRLPALMVVDKAGRVVYRHYGSSMSDSPPNQQVLDILDELDREAPGAQRAAKVRFAFPGSSRGPISAKEVLTEGYHEGLHYWCVRQTGQVHGSARAGPRL